MSFAAVHIPEFPIAAWLSQSPKLSARALILLSGVPPQETVASLNAIARASGIAHGMSKVQAETTCGAQFRSRDLHEEGAAFQLVLQTAERFSPRVQTIAAPANNYAGGNRLTAALIIDRSGTGSIFGTANAYAHRLHCELASIGFLSNVATATNAEAALMLARSDHGLVCVEQEDLEKRLGPLPVTLLPCDIKTQAILRRWGIKTLGQLAALPAVELVSRLGQGGARLQQLARGDAPQLLTPDKPAFVLLETFELDSPLEDLERLLFALSRLLGDILRKALEYAYALRSVTATFALAHAQTHTVRVAPASPTQNRDTLLKLLNLELQAHPPPSEVFAIRLEADPAQPQIGQGGLFQSQFPDPGKLDLLLARLRAIAGEQNVGSPQLANSYREDAFTMVPFLPEPADLSDELSRLGRPAVRMLRPPQNVRVWLSDDRPQVLLWRGARLKIVDTAGPWRASGSWWNETSFDCDYWDVVTTEPTYMLRLQKENVSQSWNVTGLYD